MNEKIRELAIKANANVTQRFNEDTIVLVNDDIEKFAELIGRMFITECIRVVKEHHYGDQVAQHIKEHFTGE